SQTCFYSGRYEKKLPKGDVKYCCPFKDLNLGDISLSHIGMVRDELLILYNHAHLSYVNSFTFDLESKQWQQKKSFFTNKDIWEANELRTCHESGNVYLTTYNIIGRRIGT